MQRVLFVLALGGCDKLLSLSTITPPDASNMVVFVQDAVWTDDTQNAQQIDIPVTLSSHAELCIVSIGLAGYGPTIMDVRYAGVEMSQLLAIDATGQDGGEMRTEQWWLASPDLASGVVIVTMDQPGTTSQVSALFFDNVDLTQPFGEHQTTSGHDDKSMLSVTTSATDVVESVTGQGNGIGGTGSSLSQTLFVHNVDSTTALNNSAASLTSSQGPSTIVTWQYTMQDDFETVAAALHIAQR